MANPNLSLLVGMAQAMGPVCDRIVFVGGCATGLLLSNADLMDVRATAVSYTHLTLPTIYSV